MSADTAIPMASMSSYGILGCGSVGHAVAEQLVADGKDVVIVDSDRSRVESLRDQDLDARQHDIRDEDVAEEIAGCDVVLILSSDVEANVSAIENVRARGDDQFVVARASDPVSSDRLAEAGADVVINPTAVIAESAVRALESGQLEQRADRLTQLVEGTAGQLAIRIHRGPDSDSVASAVALQAIAANSGVEADIIYNGEIGHKENRAFVNQLGIELLQASEAEANDTEYDTVAVIDQTDGEDAEHQPGTDIFIGHHSHDHEHDIPFVDIRPNLSSTSTILTKYVKQLDLRPDETVATALLYGIRTETMAFKRDTTPADLTAAAYLYPFADHDTLEQVESSSMSAETLDVLAEAIRNRDVGGSHLVSNAGFVSDRDALSQAAQLLLDLEGVSATAVFAIADGEVHLAARSKDIRLDIGRVLEDAFGDTGEVAGHSTEASAEIHLGIFTGVEVDDDNRETLLELTEQAVKTRLSDTMGFDGSSNGN